ncbi:MAG: hypothetical protein JXR83_15765 [Deltaproteobacteria bacterium]|nr:hypothetical protein [Deltaproteobacteria bacterium]
MSRTSRLGAALSLIALVACGGEFEPWLDEPGSSTLPLTAYCRAQVVGVGEVDVETDYLPHVVTCENGGAPFESLKLQAVAARTFLYYKLIHYGQIRDGTSDQVYSCSAEPGEAQRRAVRETAGQYLAYGSTTLCAFFVAGAHQSPPECRGNTSDSTNTERYVTYNWGLSGDNIHQSTLGWVDDGNYANRGCMSQWGSRCLADAGWVYTDMVKFYYGMDIGLHTAAGDCVQPPEPVNQPPRGYLDSAGCDAITGWAQDPDVADQPIDVHVYIGGPAGDPAATGFSTRADLARDDLCAAIGSCHHGFELALPGQFHDGAAHPVYAYGIDSAGGSNTLLTGSPKTVTCAPAASPDAGEPVAPDAGTAPAVDAGESTDAGEVAAEPDAGDDPADPLDPTDSNEKAGQSAGEELGPERVEIGQVPVGCSALPSTAPLGAPGLLLLALACRRRRLRRSPAA